MQKTPDFMPEFKANLPRNSHVLSHDFSFTATTGHLLPVFHTIVSPGDTVKLGWNYNVRTQPLEAAAFGDFICHTEYFFVPMELLYQPFSTSYYGVTDQWSSNYRVPVSRTLPVCDMTQLVDDLYNYRSNAAINFPGGSNIAESVGASSIRLFDMFGFCPISIAYGVGSNEFYNPNIFPYQFLAYNCIYQYYYRLDAREEFDHDSFNIDKEFNNTLFYFNRKYALLHYRPLDNDYFTDVKVSPIVDVLNLANKSSLSSVNSWLTRRSFLNSNNVESDVIGPGAHGSALSTVGGAGGTVIDPSNEVVTKFGFNAANTVYAYDAGSTARVVPNGFDINTANLRALFANEKLWSITGRAKKNYDDQTLAHFGFKVPHDPKHEITCFGKDISYIHVGEVISTASTSGAPLGEIAGKGYGQQNVGVHGFTAPCHGVVMAIFSIVCNRNYEAGVLRANAVASYEDFFIPEYDHLGMQPLFNYEVNYIGSVNWSTVGNIIGWQYRYEQWKRRYNRCTGIFKNAGGSLRGWLPTFMPYSSAQSEAPNKGKVDNPANAESYRAFLNYPVDANQLFLAQYPKQWSSSYETASYSWTHVYDNDPFVINGNVDCVLVSVMSDYSLPRLDA